MGLAFTDCRGVDAGRGMVPSPVAAGNKKARSLGPRSWSRIASDLVAYLYRRVAAEARILLCFSSSE
jgi:hypothetical protein